MIKVKEDMVLSIAIGINVCVSCNRVSSQGEMSGNPVYELLYDIHTSVMTLKVDSFRDES
jgi:hypothetical protein